MDSSPRRGTTSEHQRRDSSGVRQEIDVKIPSQLGGKSAFVLFLVALAAFVSQSAFTQYVQTNLGFRKPFLLLYIGHSSFSIILPLHILYLTCTTRKPARYFIGLILSAARAQFSTSSTDTGFPLRNTAIAMFLVTIGMTLPALLWYLAVSLASISEVTSVWNTNAFWAYLLSIWIFREKLVWRKLSAVLLACIGVATVAYSSKESSDQNQPPSDNASNPNTHAKLAPPSNQPDDEPTAPFLGDLLTLLASILYAALQVFYKRYISLPGDPSESSSPRHSRRESSPLVPYRSLATEERPSSTEPEDSQETTQEIEREIADIEAYEGRNATITSDSLPFGLFANAVTSLVGILTFLLFWLFPLFLSQTAPSLSLTASSQPQPSIEIYVTIASIAISGLVYNAAYMIVLGIWGPVLSSVGNLLTIVLMLIIETLFMDVQAPTGLSLVGCLLIGGGFGVLLWDVVKDTRGRSS